MSVAALLALVDELRPGVTELGCHPGRDDDVASVYARERSLEVETLTDPAVATYIAGRRIELTSYRAVSTDPPPVSARVSALAGAPA